MISIIGSSASQPGYYYFYYNIKVEAKCTEISTEINYNEHIPKKLIRKVDLLGKEVKYKTNQPILYLYDDGTVEKKIKID